MFNNRAFWKPLTLPVSLFPSLFISSSEVVGSLSIKRPPSFNWNRLFKFSFPTSREVLVALTTIFPELSLE
nr:MAG TPA: hypothetical protein [Bacteriophage sp.]